MSGTAKRLLTPVFRVSFPSLFAASSYEGGVPKFSVCAVFEPGKFTPKEKQLWLAIQGLADEASLQKFKKKVAQLPANFKKPFRDGEEKGDLAGFGPGKVFMSLSSKIKPGVIDLDKNELDADAVYPGCYGRATVTCYAYDNVGKGVAFGLQNFQKIKDGERLDNRTDAADDFGNAEVDDRWVGDEPDPLA